MLLVGSGKPGKLITNLRGYFTNLPGTFKVRWGTSEVHETLVTSGRFGV
jgi:hypothetical protein